MYGLFIARCANVGTGELVDSPGTSRKPCRDTAVAFNAASQLDRILVHKLAFLEVFDGQRAT
jgi:hypothetical protein